jgi:hypothetical protein
VQDLDVIGKLIVGSCSSSFIFARNMLSYSDLCNLANSAESLFSFINDHKEQDRSTVYEALLAILLIYENKDSKEWLVESIARNEDLQQVSQIDLHLNYIHSIDP